MSHTSYNTKLTSEAPSYRPVKCRQCNEQFKLYDDLEKHIKRTGHSKPFACELCGRTFNTRGMLDRHSRAKHQPGWEKETKPKAMSKWSEKSKGPRYKCPHCDRTFPYYCRLEPHLKWHSKGGSFQCATCSKTFVWESKLKQHMKMHEDEKPFSCDICGKAFKRNFHLKEHVTGAHNTAGNEASGSAPKNANKPTFKKFKCPECDQAYAYRINLARHMKRHEEKTMMQKTTKRTNRKQANDNPVDKPIVKQETGERRSNESTHHREETVPAPMLPKRERLKKAVHTTDPLGETRALEEPTVKQEESGTYQEMESYEVNDAFDTDALVADIIDGMKREVKQEPAE
ncbi:zinc finger protein [Aphelenchoides avenae]|nr:zinc finger protein [Aphelenchus avenae]